MGESLEVYQFYNVEEMLNQRFAKAYCGPWRHKWFCDASVEMCNLDAAYVTNFTY